MISVHKEFSVVCFVSIQNVCHSMSDSLSAALRSRLTLLSGKRPVKIEDRMVVIHGYFYEKMLRSEYKRAFKQMKIFWYDIVNFSLHFQKETGVVLIILLTGVDSLSWILSIPLEF